MPKFLIAMAFYPIGLQLFLLADSRLKSHEVSPIIVKVPARHLNESHTSANQFEIPIRGNRGSATIIYAQNGAVQNRSLALVTRLLA